MPGAPGRTSAASALPAGTALSAAPPAAAAAEPDSTVRRLGVSDPRLGTGSLLSPLIPPYYARFAPVVEVAKSAIVKLRTHADDRDRYAALKRDLASRGEWPDINYYADAKGPFIRELLATARGTSR